MPLLDAPDDPSIRVNEVSFGYDKSLVFDRFSFDADAPIVLLKGPNGSGKTTLLKLIAGVLQPSDSNGIKRPSPVGLILQEDALFPWLTVERNLQVAATRKRENDALSQLASIIAPLMRRQAFSLSFGQRRIVELYRILSGPFRLVCLDEPFNFLDKSTIRSVASVIASLASEGTRFVIVLHFEPEGLCWPGVAYEFDGSLPASGLTASST